ncbi:MAG TPA: hypothetical protein VLG11_04750 [Candidatus Saccharimonadales bacterium]|nr:hypothetical protein [Candidatus Saccharimonadales bacterium]
MKKLFKNTVLWTARLAVFGACGLFSAFLLMSGYESVYNRSLPFVHTLAPVSLAAFADTYNLQLKSFMNSSLYGNFGKPQTLKLPDRSLRLDVVAPLQEGQSTWLARQNTLHLLLPVQPRAGNIGIAFLYCRASFRTLNDQNLPSVGSNVFMDTDHNWRYVYKVTSAKVFPDSQPYVAADDGGASKLLIGCNDAGQHSNVVVEATLLSVQGIDQ